MSDHIPVTVAYDHPANAGQPNPRTQYTVSMDPDAVGQVLILLDALDGADPDRIDEVQQLLTQL